MKPLLRNQRGRHPQVVEMLSHGTARSAEMAVDCLVPDPALAMDSLGVGGERVTVAAQSALPLAW